MNQTHDFRIKDKYLGLLELEKELDKVSEKEDLILINSGDYLTPMYFAQHKGWVASNQSILSTGYIDSLKNVGLNTIVVLKQCFGEEIQPELEMVHDNQDYSIHAYP